MITKFDFEIDAQIFNTNINRLTNQIWKMIPMWENGENWKKQLATVEIELLGLNKIFVDNPSFLQILSKIEGIPQLNNISFDIFRKTIFEIISLLQGLRKQ